MFDIISLFKIFAKFFDGLFGSLNTIQFQVNYIEVTLLDLIVGFIFMCMIISVFWKGARK